jgi:phasin family protein
VKPDDYKEPHMNPQPELILAERNAAVDAVLTTVSVAFDAAERLAALNLNTLRATFDDGSAAIRALLDAKDPQAFFSIQAGLAQPFAERTLAWFRHSYEIGTQGFEAAAKPVEQRVAQMNQTVAAELERAARAAPVGSDAAVAALKSGIAAANSTFDQVNRATRQAIQMAEANLAAAGDAAAKAVSAPVTKGRKSA